jgi:hypothetical protein
MSPGAGIATGTCVIHLLRTPVLFGEVVVCRVDPSDDRRAAESVLAIETCEIPDVIVKLAKAKRLSVVMRRVNRLLMNPDERELGRRALHHLGFPDD